MTSQIHKQQYLVNLEVNRLESGAEMIMSDSQLLIIRENLINNFTQRIMS